MFENVQYSYSPSITVLVLAIKLFAVLVLVLAIKFFTILVLVLAIKIFTVLVLAIKFPRDEDTITYDALAKVLGLNQHLPQYD